MQALSPDSMVASWCESPCGLLPAGPQVLRRARTGFLWRFDTRRSVVVVGAFEADPTALTAALREWGAMLPGETTELILDWRGLRLGSTGAELDALHRAIDAGLVGLSGRLTQLVAVTPDDWSRPWWHGVHAVAALGCRWLVVHELEEACRALDLPHELADELAALTAGTRRSVVSLVENLLRARPEADTEEVARALSMSTRSLQRALGSEGQTFLAVRDRVRLAAAQASLRRGHKIETAASEVGFASTSHFVRWFRMRAGVTPSDFRRADAAKGA